MLNQILTALWSQIEAINGRPNGIGHGFSDGVELKCAGEPGEDNSIINRHTIGHFKAGPDGIAVGNPNEGSDFIVDASQTSFDPTNPVCFCGKGAKL